MTPRHPLDAARQDSKIRAQATGRTTQDEEAPENLEIDEDGEREKRQSVSFDDWLDDKVPRSRENNSSQMRSVKAGFERLTAERDTLLHDIQQLKDQKSAFASILHQLKAGIEMGDEVARESDYINLIRTVNEYAEQWTRLVDIVGMKLPAAPTKLYFENLAGRHFPDNRLSRPKDIFYLNDHRFRLTPSRASDSKKRSGETLENDRAAKRHAGNSGET